MIERRNGKNAGQRKHKFFSSHRSHTLSLVPETKRQTKTTHQKDAESSSWLPAFRWSVATFILSLLPKTVAETDIPPLKTYYFQELISKNNYTIKGYYLSSWFKKGICNTSLLQAGATYHKVVTLCEGSHIYAGEGTSSNTTDTIHCIITAANDHCHDLWILDMITLGCVGAACLVGVCGGCMYLIDLYKNRPTELAEPGTQLYQVLN